MKKFFYYISTILLLAAFILPAQKSFASHNGPPPDPSGISGPALTGLGLDGYDTDGAGALDHRTAQWYEAFVTYLEEHGYGAGEASVIADTIVRGCGSPESCARDFFTPQGMRPEGSSGPGEPMKFVDRRTTEGRTNLATKPDCTTLGQPIPTPDHSLSNTDNDERQQYVQQVVNYLVCNPNIKDGYRDAVLVSWTLVDKNEADRGARWLDVTRTIIENRASGTSNQNLAEQVQQRREAVAAAQAAEYAQVNDDKECSLLGWTLSGCLEYGILKIFSLIIYILGKILILIVFLFEQTLRISVLEFAQWAKLPFVTEGWAIMRDTANIFFIFILLYIAIGTILGLHEVNAQKAVVKLVIVALLINFSAVITRTIIDSGNILGVWFYNKATRGTGKSVGDALIAGLDLQNLIGTTGAGGLSEGITSAVSQGSPGTQALEGSTNNLANAGQGSRVETIPARGDVPASSTLQPASDRTSIKTLLVSAFGAIVFILITAFVFMAAALFFLVRMIVLIFLIMTSPFAFMASIIPGLSSISSQWWSRLTKETLFAPAFFLPFMVVLTMVTSRQGAGLSGTGGQFIGAVIYFIVIIGMMMACLIIAANMGAFGAKKAVGMGKALIGGSVAFAGAHTIGRASQRLLETDTFKGIAARVPGGRYATNALKGVAGSSFGGDMLGYKGGGYVDKMHAKEKAVEEHGEYLMKDKHGETTEEGIERAQKYAASQANAPIIRRDEEGNVSALGTALGAVRWAGYRLTGGGAGAEGGSHKLEKKIGGEEKTLEKKKREAEKTARKQALQDGVDPQTGAQQLGEISVAQNKVDTQSNALVQSLKDAGDLQDAALKVLIERLDAARADVRTRPNGATEADKEKIRNLQNSIVLAIRESKSEKVTNNVTIERERQKVIDAKSDLAVLVNELKGIDQYFKDEQDKKDLKESIRSELSQSKGGGKSHGGGKHEEEEEDHAPTAGGHGSPAGGSHPH